jgi:hypothetical protein
MADVAVLTVVRERPHVSFAPGRLLLFLLGKRRRRLCVRRVLLLIGHALAYPARAEITPCARPSSGRPCGDRPDLRSVRVFH